MDDTAASFDLDVTAQQEAHKPPHLLHVFPSYGHGGVPIRIATVINHFGDRYRHTILALDGNKDAESRLDPALNIPVSDPGIDKGRPLGALFQIRKVLKDLNPDLLLTYNWGSVEWAMINCLSAVAPQIHFESGFGPEEADGQIPRRVWARRMALSRIKALVVAAEGDSAIWMREALAADQDTDVVSDRVADQGTNRGTDVVSHGVTDQGTDQGGRSCRAVFGAFFALFCSPSGTAKWGLFSRGSQS